MENLRKKIDDYSDYLIANGAVILGELISGVIGGIGIPVLSNSIIVYKQKRFEKNIKIFLSELENNYKYLEDMLKNIDETAVSFMKYSAFPITLDYVSDEKQIGKIRYYFSGLKRIILEDICYLKNNESIDCESLMIMYFDILKQLTIFDIGLLEKIMNRNIESKYNDGKPLDKSDLVEISLKYSIDKLCKMGLILKPMTWGEFDGEDEYIHSLNNIKITGVGEKFYKFIFEDKENSLMI